jgi:predicted unusual protein kinase regulating ubiquinone biosynthesis (AarF/ABC1/UbiB family)
LIPGSRIRDGKKSRSGSGMNIPDHISDRLETIFGVKILKFFHADPDPGSGNFDSLSGIQDGKIWIRGDF